MKYSLLALITLLVISGCAPKKKEVAQVPGVHHYKGCHEVSVNYKTQEITVICPLEVQK